MKLPRTSYVSTICMDILVVFTIASDRVYTAVCMVADSPYFCTAEYTRNTFTGATCE